MSSSFGRRLKVSLFGQSHSKAVGVVLDGLPAGEKIDFVALESFLKRRTPGRSPYATPRQEADTPIFLSGLVGDVTCGAPLAVMIENLDTRSADYAMTADIPRPSHADYPAYVRHGGYNDVSGGGHFSARLTAPLCVAGGICMQLLGRRGITIGGHIASIGGIQDASFDPVRLTPEEITAPGKKELAVLNDEAGERMKAAIKGARDSLDSLGGVIECAILGMPPGIGDPVFEGVENQLAKAVFAIPAVKGIAFGLGFSAAAVPGSVNNDLFLINNNGAIQTKTNHHGGILGGLTSGMPILFQTAFKPTPSIGREQDSVSLKDNSPVKLTIQGRHDPCVAVRAVPCVESAAAITILDFIL